MIITPISGINLADELAKTAQAQSGQEDFVSFKELLNNMIEKVNTTDAAAKEGAIKVATGQSDDLHTFMIEAAKADLALQTLVQIRNKALEAYSEIMRITL